MRPVFALVLVVGCQGLSGDYFKKDGVRYRVAELDRSEWKQVGFEGNDLAWLGPQGQLLAMNATCENYGDPPLEVLTNHLLMGFTDKQLSGRKAFVLDGRDALESSFTARLDGVPVDIAVVVLKKDGCVHDFTYVAPLGRGHEHRAQLDALLDGFTTTDRRPQGRTATVRLGAPEVSPDDGSSSADSGPQEAKVQ